MIELEPRKTQYVRKGNSEPIRASHCVQHRQPSKKLLVWGCITADGPASISSIIGTMDSTRYIETLKDHVLPFREHFNTFVQDNVPCHKFKAVLSFLSENKISMLDWPARSPDINPRENIWNVLKNKVKTGEAHSLSELATLVKSTWFNDANIKHTCQSAVKLMPCLIQSCIKARGGYIPY